MKSEEELWKESIEYARTRIGSFNRMLKDLEYFRFFKCWNHHHAANGDHLDCCIRYTRQEGLESLLRFFDAVEIKSKPLPVYANRTTNGYHHMTNLPFDPLIAKAFYLIAGHLALLQITESQVLITINTAEPSYLSYEIEDRHIEAAKVIESIIKEYNLEVIDPPLDIRNYLCPKYHPKYFS